MNEGEAHDNPAENLVDRSGGAGRLESMLRVSAAQRRENIPDFSINFLNAGRPLPFCPRAGAAAQMALIAAVLGALGVLISLPQPKPSAPLTAGTSPALASFSPESLELAATAPLRSEFREMRIDFDNTARSILASVP